MKLQTACFDTLDRLCARFYRGADLHAPDTGPEPQSAQRSTRNRRRAETARGRWWRGPERAIPCWSCVSIASDGRCPDHTVVEQFHARRPSIWLCLCPRTLALRVPEPPSTPQPNRLPRALPKDSHWLLPCKSPRGSHRSLRVQPKGGGAGQHLRRNIFRPPPPPATETVVNESRPRWPNTGAVSGVKSALRDLSPTAVTEIDPA